MSYIVYDNTDSQIKLTEHDDIDTDYLKNRFQTFDIYNEFNKLTDPVEGFKKIFNRLSNSPMPYFINLYCGAQYIALVQKHSDGYGYAIIFGYAITRPKIVKVYDNVWGNLDL